MSDTDPNSAAPRALRTDSPDFAAAVEAIRTLLDEFGRSLGAAAPTMTGIPKITPCEDPSDPDGPWQVTVQDYWATEPDAGLLAEAPTAAAEVFAGWQADVGQCPERDQQPTDGTALRLRRADGLLTAFVKAGSDSTRGWLTVALSTPCATGPRPQPGP